MYLLKLQSLLEGESQSMLSVLGMIKNPPCSETDSLANLKRILGLAVRQEYFTNAGCMNTF